MRFKRMRYILCISIRYESCVQWDVYHLDAQQRLAELKECNRVREQLNTTCSTWFQQHPEEESAIKLVKKITLTHLASLHPMLLSEQRIQLIAAASPSNERIQLSVARWMQKRGDWLGSQHVLEMYFSSLLFTSSLFSRGVRSPPLLMELGNVLVTRSPEKLPVLLQEIQKVTNPPLTADVAYWQGLHALGRKDFYAALEHLDFALSLRPHASSIWRFIGQVRSQLVGVRNVNHCGTTMKWQLRRWTLRQSGRRRSR